MMTEERTENLAKARIMALLSDEETARVSNAEAGFSMTHGEEYIDLQHLDSGLQKARGNIGSLGEIIPRKAVHRDTWAKIMAGLPPRDASATPSDH